MLNSLLSPTRFLSFESMTGEDLADAVAIAAPGARNVVLVRDGRPSAAVDSLAEGLRARYAIVVMDKVRPDPLAADVSAMAGDGRLGKPDLVIGLGGGSVMDSAKALAMLTVNGGSLEDYLGPAPARKIERKGLPLVLVPTTAGTGAEATKVGVFTAASGRKYTLGSPHLQADVALLSGALASSMPPALAASTGFDALSHALESMWNRNATPLSLEASTRAALLVLEALPAAWEAASRAAVGIKVESHDAVALRMLEAAASAGIAFSGTGTALVHALSFVLSEDWHVPHGSACAFTLEDAWRLEARDPEIARRLGGLALRWTRGRGGPTQDAGTALGLLLDHIVSEKRRMGLPFTFADLGVSIAPDEVESRFARAFDDPKMANSMPAADRGEIVAMLKGKA